MDIMELVEDETMEANDELARLTSNGFPFELGEVEISYDTIASGICVYCGSVPICAMSLKGDRSKIVNTIRNKIRRAVDSVRTAVDHRGALKKEADRLVEDDVARRAAISALEKAGMNPEDVLGRFDKDAANAIVDAARKAAHKANRGLFMRFREISHLVGGLKGMRLVVRGYLGGLVVSAGGKPCLVSRFPKAWNARSVSKMISFLEADISAIGDSRRRYFFSVLDESRNEERLLDEVNAA